jgi:hypothetical protein
LLSDSTEENKGQIYANLMLQKSVLSDINDEKVYQEIVALAIIGKIITTPFMTLVETLLHSTNFYAEEMWFSSQNSQFRPSVFNAFLNCAQYMID